ncbi:MAG: glycine cleavage system protein GcvH [Promethearchaeota archaeon]
MNVPDNLKYTKSDEWILMEDENVIVIGITDYAQDQLTDIVYVDDFPDLEDNVSKGSVIAMIESVKAVAEVYSPADGTVIAINESLENTPELLNEKPYDAWIIKMRVKSTSSLDGLLDPGEYKEKISK